MTSQIEADAFLAAIIDSAEDAIISKNLDGIIMSWNAAAERIFGYRAEEVVGRSIYLLIPPELMDEEAVILARLKQGERIEHYETVRLRKDSSRIDVSLTNSPIKNGNGEIIGASKIARDITDRKRKAQELRESEERFRTLADNIAQFAWMADEQGSVFWFNQRWFDYTGTTFDEMRGWGWQKVHHPDHVDRVMKKIRHSFETGECWEDTFPLRGKDGSYRWFLSRAVPIRDPHGRVVRWLGTNTDITEQRETEQALHEAHEELGRRAADLEKAVAERTMHLEQTIAELEGVSYSLSHDMRAPLRTIHSFAEIVLAEAGDRLGPNEKELLQRSISAANRLDRLIRDVLVYSRVSRERIELSTINVEELLRQIMQERPEFQEPNAEIRIESPLARVRGHEAYLTQCITNLLDNAVKFVPPGRKPQVRIWSEKVQSEVRLWFEDNGIGIAPDAQERVFGIFQRIHGEKEYSGTGIGLAIVRKAAQRMGGSVGVESKPGEGSRFWLSLPRAE
jgi:PAS domain S-box-containing protein